MEIRSVPMLVPWRAQTMDSEKAQPWDHSMVRYSVHLKATLREMQWLGSLMDIDLDLLSVPCSDHALDPWSETLRVPYLDYLSVWQWLDYPTVPLLVPPSVPLLATLSVPSWEILLGSMLDF